MQIKPIWSFDNKDSKRINEVPVGGRVYIEDWSGYPREVIKKTMGSLDGTTTIEDFLGDETLFSEIAISSKADAIPGAGVIENIVSISQEDYEALVEEDLLNPKIAYFGVRTITMLMELEITSGKIPTFVTNGDTTTRIILQETVGGNDIYRVISFDRIEDFAVADTADNDEIKRMTFNMFKHITGVADLFKEASTIENITFEERCGIKTITNMDFMFRNLAHLNHLDISGIVTSGVTSMEQSFHNIGNGLVNKIITKNFTTSSVTNFRNTFNGTKKLRCLPALDTTSAVDTYNMFAHSGGGATNYTLLHPTSDERRALMDGTLTQWSNVNEDPAPDYVLVVKIKTDSVPEFDITGGGTITITKTSSDANSDYYRIVSDGNIDSLKFKDVASSSDVEEVDAVYYYGNDYSFMFSPANNKMTSLTRVNLQSNGQTLSRSISLESMFEGCSALAELTGFEEYIISEYVANSHVKGPNSFKRMFKNCTSLSGAFDLSQWRFSVFEAGNTNTSGTFNDTSEMFMNCSNISSFILPFLRSKNSTSMLEGCSAATSIQVVEVGQTSARMFYGCSAVTEIRIINSGLSTSGSTESIFEGCSELKYLFNESMSSFGANSNNAFKGCAKLESIARCNTNDVQDDNYTGMFDGCDKLRHPTFEVQREIMSPMSADPDYGYVGFNYINDLPVDTDIRFKMMISVTEDNDGRPFWIFNGGTVTEVDIGRAWYYTSTDEITGFKIDLDNTSSDNYPDHFGSVILLRADDITTLEDAFATTGGDLTNFRNFTLLEDASLRNITSMKNAFLNCTSISNIRLTSIIPDPDISKTYTEPVTTNCTNFEGTFEGCTHSGSYCMPGLDISNATTTARMFKDCNCIDKLHHLNTLNATDKTDMFTGSDVTEPNASEISDLTSSGGSDWTNPNGCQQ